MKKAHRAHLSLLRDALGRQAYSALTASPGARAYYDQLRARKIEHDEATAWHQYSSRHCPTAA